MDIQDDDDAEKCDTISNELSSHLNLSDGLLA